MKKNKDIASTDTDEQSITPLCLGDTVPDVSLSLTQSGTQTSTQPSTSFNSYRGRWIVLYFYPKDSTPGCTTESENFRDLQADFHGLNTCILGVSRDSLASHARFKDNLQLPFELISDSDEELCQLFDVIKIKNMYGREVLGVERSTFLIDPSGVIRHEWRKVKVPGHAEAVLAARKTCTDTV